MSNLPIREAGAVFAIGLAYLLIRMMTAGSGSEISQMFPIFGVALALWMIDAVLMGRRDQEEKALYRAIVGIGEDMNDGSPLETAVYRAAQRGGVEGQFFHRVLVDAQGTDLCQAFNKAAHEAKNAEAAEAAYLMSLVAWSNQAGGGVVRWMGTYLEKIQVAEEEMKKKLFGRFLTFRGMGIVAVPLISAMLAKSLSVTDQFQNAQNILPIEATYYFIVIAIALASVEGIVFREWLRAPYKIPAYLCIVHVCTFWV